MYVKSNGHEVGCSWIRYSQPWTTSVSERGISSRQSSEVKGGYIDISKQDATWAATAPAEILAQQDGRVMTMTITKKSN